MAMPLEASNPCIKWPPRSAILIFIVLVLIISYGLYIARPPTHGAIGNGRVVNDSDYYISIIKHIQAGENYYAAAASEMRQRQTESGSAFNWRLPTLSLLLANLPGGNAPNLLAFLLALATLLIWMTIFHEKRYSLVQTAIGTVILTGPLAYSFLSEPILYHEYWAGILIALSLAVYGKGWWRISVLCGLAALSVRELALPFVCFMAVLSYVEGRRRETLIWLLGIFAFGGAYFFHWSLASSFILEESAAVQKGWLAFGGWPFVLSTAQMHPYLLISPKWITAILLPLALLGYAGCPGKLGYRIAGTVGIYVIAYCFWGRPENEYWGLLFAFIAPLGLLNAPICLRSLWRSVHNA